ncbi:LOG family protein [Kordia jejudonensis]|uniref:LOG family protein n=1 Tax=Kordia jejudonensis TaxID=1348245 RepID=UPI0029345325|nr:TIGR00730 family Rossman fold protein [Kordia jejudonensis]
MKHLELTFLKPKTQNPKPKTQNPKPKTQNPKPKTQNPKPKTQNPKPKTQNPKPKTQNPKPKTQNPKPKTQNPKPKTQNPKPKTQNPKPKTQNPKPKTQNPKPKTQNPKPKTQNPKPKTQNPKPKTQNPKPKTQNPKPKTQNPKPKTQNPKPKTQNPKPKTQNPKPKTQNPKPKTQNPKPKTQKMKSIAVYCGSSLGNDDKIVTDARELGKALATKNITLIYGGSQVGIMGVVANTVLENGGTVIGIIPEFLKSREVAHLGISELHTTKTMVERKMKMIDLAEGFIALPGGFGTMEELFEVITALQLGQMKHPVAILNSNGYYDELIAMMHTMMKKGLLKEKNFDMLIIETDSTRLLDRMQNFVPKVTSKYLK